MNTTIVAFGNAMWEANMLSALNHPHSNVRIFRRCVDGVDIRATAQVHEIDLVLLSDDTLRIDVNLVSDLQALGIRVVAFSCDSQFWADLGVHETLKVDVRNVSKTISELDKLLTNSVEIPIQTRLATGALVALASFGGGVGRSLFLREFGFLCATKNYLTACVEADTYGPSLVQDLNLPIDTFHLLELCKTVNRFSELENVEPLNIVDRCAVVATNLAIVPGISRATQWVDIRFELIQKVYESLRSQFGVTVIDVGPVLESEPLSGFDIGLPRRQAATLGAMKHASDIVFFTRAEEVSVTRFIKNFLEQSDVFSDANVHVVINQVRDKSLGRELEKSIQRYSGITSILTVDENVSDVARASRKHDFIARLSPKSPLVKQCDQLIERILAPTVATSSDVKLHQLIQHTEVA